MRSVGPLGASPIGVLQHTDPSKCPGQMRQNIVEVAGIEPASSGVSIGLLRAQPALDCRGRHHCRRLCRPVANKVFLSVQLV